ncbi:hypothetical protein NC652_024991 [Populus alba x Populus x berolinensis]|nr:hypothetical protein NC652_024991 [Populus alba x Populus x berolinensis]
MGAHTSHQTDAFLHQGPEDELFSPGISAHNICDREIFKM